MPTPDDYDAAIRSRNWYKAAGLGVPEEVRLVIETYEQGGGAEQPDAPTSYSRPAYDWELDEEYLMAKKPVSKKDMPMKKKDMPMKDKDMRKKMPPWMKKDDDEKKRKPTPKRKK